MKRDTNHFWNNRKVFITGATGMIGSWLVKELIAREAEVVVLVKDADPKSELYRSGDVNRTAVVQGALEDFWALEQALNLHEPDTVFHLGAQSLVGVAQRFPLNTFESNIRGTYNLLEASRIHSGMIRALIVASSDKAYGEQNLPYLEDMSLKGQYPYEVSKSCADMLTQSYYHAYGLPVAIARCGNTYGGGDLNWSRIVPGTIKDYLRGKKPVIRSNGTFVRDYIYVKDVANAYLRLAELVDNDQVKGEAFNFSDETPKTVLDIVAQIQKLMGYEHLNPEIRNTAVGEIPNQYLSAQKAREKLDWKPGYQLEEGLKETIEWYRDFFGRVL